MTEEAKPPGETPKKKINPLVLIGPAIAIAAALLIIFMGGGKDKDGPPPEMGPDTAQASPVPGADPVQTASASQTDPTVAPTSAPPSGPAIESEVAFKDESLEFNATFPAAPADDPVINALRKDAESYLTRKKSKARAAFNAAKKAGETSTPWDVNIEWTYSAKAGGILSLLGVSSEYEGGAHPIQLFDTYIARATGEKLALNDMMILKHSPSPAMIIALCEALKAEKKSRIGSATVFDEPIVCTGGKANVKIENAKLVLAPSNQPNKFGGVYAHFDPYEVGAYAEGAYSVAVQQQIFAEDLKPEFKPLFAGEAPPVAN